MSPRSEGDAATSAAEALGAWCTQLAASPLDTETERHALRALVDTFGCALAGSRADTRRALGRALAGEVGAPAPHSADPDSGDPDPIGPDPAAPDTATGTAYPRALVYPEMRTAPARVAALLNGTAAHAAEADDIYRDGIVHPGAPVVAAALASAQAEGADGARLLRAIVAGYEVVARVSVALGAGHYARFHTTGTAGALGAAAAVAVVLQLDAGRTAHAIATAATFAAGLRAALGPGSDDKPLHAGRAAEAGVLAAYAAREGIRGAPDALEGPGGLLDAMSGDGDRSVLTSGLDTGFGSVLGSALGSGVDARPAGGTGARLAVTRVTFKNHLCCGHAFAALDAGLELRARHHLRPDDIAEVRVGTYRAALEVAGHPDPATPAEARFSLPFLVARALVHGSVRLAAFEPEGLADPAVRSLMGRVRLEVDPAADAAFPGERGAVVAIETRSGEHHEWRQPFRRGDPEAPLTDEGLDAKFCELAAPVVGAAAAERLRAELWGAAAAPTVRFAVDAPDGTHAGSATAAGHGEQAGSPTAADPRNRAGSPTAASLRGRGA